MISLEKEIINSLKFISGRCKDFKFLDVANVHLESYNRLYSRECYKQGKFSLSEQEGQNIGLDALRLTGRYCRRFGGYVGDDVK